MLRSRSSNHRSAVLSLGTKEVSPVRARLLHHPCPAPPPASSITGPSSPRMCDVDLPSSPAGRAGGFVYRCFDPSGWSMVWQRGDVVTVQSGSGWELCEMDVREATASMRNKLAPAGTHASHAATALDSAATSSRRVACAALSPSLRRHTPEHAISFTFVAQSS